MKWQNIVQMSINKLGWQFAKLRQFLIWDWIMTDFLRFLFYKKSKNYQASKQVFLLYLRSDV